MRNKKPLVTGQVVFYYGQHLKSSLFGGDTAAAGANSHEDQGDDVGGSGKACQIDQEAPRIGHQLLHHGINRQGGIAMGTDEEHMEGLGLE